MYVWESCGEGEKLVAKDGYRMNEQKRAAPGGSCRNESCRDVQHCLRRSKQRQELKEKVGAEQVGRVSALVLDEVGS